MKLPVTILLAALIVFLNGVALGKTVVLDQINLLLEVPDDFNQQDANVEHSVYSAVRKGPKGTETICVTAIDGARDLTDPDYPTSVSEKYVRSGFHVSSCELRDMGEYKAIVSNIHNQQFSEATYEICSNNHIITVIFMQAPPIEGRLTNDLMVNAVMNSLAFVSSPEAPESPSTSSSSGHSSIALNFGLALFVIFIILRKASRLANMIKRM